MVVLGIIIRVTTDTGTVRIDVKDPNVVVRVDGQQIHIWDCLAAANQKWVLP